MFLIPPESYRIRKTAKKGRAVFAKQEIEPGTVIGDYVGKIMHGDKENEMRDGLYTMWANAKFDILANPRKIGMHILNHSCANNCDVFPHKGHMIVFANRRIFRGEEMTINYSLTTCEKGNGIPCALHQCYCGSEVCLGTMHVRVRSGVDPWEQFVIKHQGKDFRRLLGPYGSELPPLARYPKNVGEYLMYNVFGDEKKTPAVYRDRTLPSLKEVHHRIRETGRQLNFPALHLRLRGIRDGMLMGDRI